ncbi:hypothetical protein PROFUN_02547 [Planoprotostelium fungivorum]|uniref:protein-serine/threonine phosphatase n=1 Tax=Planoprotostelium fungivorum TaxID=1890364 RepID=A0A2P6MP95_9EUKA|nr:hypothetical protein PROFUN_02547 [Planoprotostelium fungivorum]
MNNSSGLNLNRYIEQLHKCEILSESSVRELCSKLKEHLIDEPNVVSVQAPVTVVGDVQGQFYDLLEIFRVGGACPDVNYLFLGSFTNRGLFSVETVTLLLCLKLKWPSRITLLRGSHESRALTQVYGLYSECMRKYGNPNVWNYLTNLFDYLPVCAVIDDKIFAVHGGLSPEISCLDQIRVMNRFIEIAPEGPLTDLIWSDPDPEHEGFGYSNRNAGCSFGFTSVQRFLQGNRLDHIVRGHQLCMDGYQVLFDKKLSTIWSAPNYGYRCGNVGSILEISEFLTKHYNTFLACPDAERDIPDIDLLKDMPDYFV